VSAARPIEVTSIVDRVYEELRERIASGALPRGARLRQEALAADLGVSRTPLREALRRLASEGVVVLEPNRGARVADVSLDDMMAAYEARLLLEPGAARLAAERRERASLAQMRAAIADHRRARSRPALFAANRAFHLALVEAAGNEHLLRFAEVLWVARIGAAIYEQQDETRAEVAADADDHERIADAIEAGEGGAAEALTRDHIARAVQTFAERAGTGPSQQGP
jgi:DNA-binding GntR family transcriptional regulator